jgi:hypothetical protein
MQIHFRIKPKGPQIQIKRRKQKLKIVVTETKRCIFKDFSDKIASHLDFKFQPTQRTFTKVFNSSSFCFTFAELTSIANTNKGRLYGPQALNKLKRKSNRAVNTQRFK